MNKRNVIIIISVLAFIVIIGGISYSYFVYNKDIGTVSINTGEISIDFSNSNGNKTLANVIPLSDNDGKTISDYFDFTVNSTVDTESIKYEIEIVPDSDNTLSSSNVKVYLTDQNDNIIVSPFLYSELMDSENNTGKALYQDIIEATTGEISTSSRNFRLRLWIDENCSDVASKQFSFDINLYAYNVDSSQYKKIVFYTQDGRMGLSKYVVNGEQYGYLPSVIKTGYNFVEWEDLTAGGYKYLDYVQSTGSQYIDTGVSGGDNLSFEIKYEWVELPETGRYANVFANYVSEDANVERIIQYGPSITYVTNNSKTGSSASYNFTRQIGTIYNERLTADSYQVNNDSIALVNRPNGTDNNTNIIIFTGNSNVSSTFSKIKLYNFKIYRNNNLIRDFQPVINSDDEVGLYDIVNEQFYSSVGDLTYGSILSNGNIELVAKMAVAS